MMGCKICSNLVVFNYLQTSKQWQRSRETAPLKSMCRCYLQLDLAQQLV
jgi:hypothetical protein